MKVAIVHELLTMRGGAEKVAKIFADMFPDAPIYTLLYNEKKLGDWFPKERVRTSDLQPHFPFSIFNFPFLYNHHLYLRKFPSAVEAWDFSEFDLVLSSSSAFVHGIITNGKPKHLCYVHSPARYLWDRTNEIIERAEKGIVGPLRRKYLASAFHDLRIWDAESADRPDRLLAASKTVQRRIELYWRRESDVVYPPIEDFWLQKNPTPNPQPPTPYFLVVSTLVPYKRIELAIEACNALKLPLKIVGEGPARKSLEKLAGATVEFLGYQTDEQLKELYTNAKATIFPGDEDFGLVPLESLACGTPVIAFKSGGALETLKQNETAEFFDEPTSESLQDATARFGSKMWNSEILRAQAQEFSKEKFVRAIQETISQIMK